MTISRRATLAGAVALAATAALPNSPRADSLAAQADIDLDAAERRFITNYRAYQAGRRDAARFLAMSPQEREEHLRAREAAGEDVRIERWMETASREELREFGSALEELLGIAR